MDDHVRLDTGVPHSARLWNHLLGGKDNVAADRVAAEQVLAFLPELVQSARFNRQFLGRAVRHLVRVEGVRQFLDIGTGLPTADNTHAVRLSRTILLPVETDAGRDRNVDSTSGTPVAQRNGPVTQ